MVEFEDPTEDDFKLVRQQLRYTNPEYVQKVRFGTRYGPMPPQYRYGFLEHQGRLFVPRAWYFSSQSRPHVVKTQDVPQEFPSPLLYPRKHQFEAITEFVDLVNTNDDIGRPTDSYIVIPPGEGKSILGMLLASCVRQKTLVVVPTKEIETTWRKDCAKCYGPQFKVGTIRAGKVDIEHPISVGSIQTLMDLDPRLWADKFGFVIFDELHRLGADKFSNVARRALANIRLGLTATDFRRDGRFTNVQWHLGTPVYRSEERTNTVPLEYHAIITNYGLTRNKEDFEFHELLADLQNNVERCEAVAWLAQQLVQEVGDVLIVSPRKEHLRQIYSLLAARCIPTVMIDGETPNRAKLFDEICAGVYRVTVATTQIMSEGASNPRWYHVINTMPFSDPKTAIQLSGRVVRQAAGKTVGKFWDFVDANPMCRSMYAQRWKALKKHLRMTRTYTLTPDPANRSFSLIPRRTT